MASPTFRSGSANSALLTSMVTILTPAGLQVGDLMLAWIATSQNGNPLTLSAPSGWGILGPGPTAGLPPVEPFPSALFFKTAGVNEPTSYTFGCAGNTTTSLTGIIVAYYNAKAVDSFTTSATAGSAFSLAAAPITTTQNSEIVLAFWFAYGNGSNVTIGLPGGVTSRVNYGGTTPTGTGIALGDYTGPSTPGSSSPGTASVLTSSNWGSVTLTLLSLVPLSPTLGIPQNGSYADIATSEGPFTWTYNSGGASGGQTAWHFRRRTIGGSYSYWSNATPGWQGTDVANSGSIQTFTFPAASWADGNQYLWSVATEDANGVGPYATDFLLNAQAAPTVSATAPTGTVTATQLPTVTWTDTLASGGSQYSYRVVTYSQAQYSAGGFTPGSGPSIDDSGPVISAATSYAVATHLLNAASPYRAYVQVVQSPGQQVSAWAFTQWTQGVTQPAAPSLTAVAGNDSVTGAPRIRLTATGSGGSIVILRSDGLYVRFASYANPAVEGSGNVAIVDDFEVIPGTNYTYQAQEIVSNVYGALSAATTATQVAPGQGWWELDPTNPGTAVAAQLLQFNPQQYEQSTAHQVLGQVTTNVVASVVQNSDMTAVAETFSVAQYNGLVALTQSQKTVWFSDPYGVGPWYFRLNPSPGGMSGGTGNKAHDTQMLPSTAAGPHRTVAISGVAQPRPPV